MSNRLDVVAIGNAIVDVVVQVDDSFLSDNGVEKGIMTLIAVSYTHLTLPTKRIV